MIGRRRSGGQARLAMPAAAFLFAVAVTAVAAAQAGPRPLRGTFASTCAPYDGPAFEIGLNSKRARVRFWLRAMVPLKDAVGTWRTSAQPAPGDGWIGLCRIQGRTGCLDAKDGSFTVTSLTETRMEGRFEAQLEDGRRFRHSFVAIPAPGPAPRGRGFCG